MNELYHHGVKGQKWGVRRYQNPDGTLTTKGIKRYSGKKGVAKYLYDKSDYRNKTKEDTQIVGSLFGAVGAARYVVREGRRIRNNDLSKASTLDLIGTAAFAAGITAITHMALEGQYVNKFNNKNSQEYREAREYLRRQGVNV